MRIEIPPAPLFQRGEDLSGVRSVPHRKEKKMDPKMLAAFLLIERIITDGPEIINSISAAWQKVDPTAEDFDALVTVMEAQRPKDPLKKEWTMINGQ